MEVTFQLGSKLLTFSLRRLSTSSFILNFSECDYIRYNCTRGLIPKMTENIVRNFSYIYDRNGTQHAQSKTRSMLWEKGES